VVIVQPLSELLSCRHACYKGIISVIFIYFSVKHRFFVRLMFLLQMSNEVIAFKGLMEEFDDVKKLCVSEKGCLLLQLVEVT